jgi:cell division protein FtsX
MHTIIFAFIGALVSFHIIICLISTGVMLGYNKVMKTLAPSKQRFTGLEVFLSLIIGPLLLGLNLGSALASMNLDLEKPEA